MPWPDDVRTPAFSRHPTKVRAVGWCCTQCANSAWRSASCAQCGGSASRPPH